MYIPYPRRIEYAHAGIAAAVLSGVLLWEGNALSLCAIVFAQIMVSTFGFNIAGGLSSPAGSYIFFITILTGTLGTVVKAVLNEPLVENVEYAGKTLLVYLVGTCALIGAIKLSQYFRPSRPFLQAGLTRGNTSRVVAGCFFLTAVIPLAIQALSSNSDSGSTASLVRQLNLAAPLGILIAVYQRVRFTNGRSSFTVLAFVIAVYSTVTGLLGYSKEGIFYPTFAWILAAAAARLRVNLVTIFITAALVSAGMLILVPFSQYGRSYRDQGASKAIELLSHPLETREAAIALEVQEQNLNYRWFRKSQGLFDRLTLVPIDAGLVSRTDQVGPIGLRNVFIYLENIVPHFLAPNKPDLLSGNEYAHELGMLSDADRTTGISFSPFAEAYHLAGWVGLLFVMPALQFIMLVIIQWAAGTVDETPWSLFYIVAFGHVAAEGGLTLPVYMSAAGTIALVVTALTMIYLAPLLGTFIIGPGKTRTA